MPKPTPLSGFPELLPAQRVVERGSSTRSRARLRAARLRQHRDPRRSSRSTRCWPRAARSTRRSTSCVGCRPAPTERRRRRPRLHFDLTVPFARYVLENAGRPRVPVPPLPGADGLARRAPPGRPLPPVHAGRHRRRRTRHAVLPPRRRGGAGDGRRAAPLRLPARLPAAGQQPQAPRGLLPRPRPRRRRPGDDGRRQARQAVADGGRRAAGRGAGVTRSVARRCLAIAAIRAPTPPSSTRCAPSASRTRCSRRA